MEVSADTRVNPTPKTTVRALEDRAVVVDLGSGLCWELNPVATAIWNLLADGKSVRETAESIASRFSVAPEVSSADTLALVQSLLKEGLVRIAETAPVSR